ncbi:peptidase C39 family protein [Nocardioides sp. GY 10113]|uniref:C39 family peptidase n=1 Tax=Nocardioides sp. GY 10113 TaxID=2569761 RepID=UPI0010A8EC99|nr:C39 family peptidase [Nocardioides sp. GY 10113]TIC88450.1 peptidase C39 family protein [Nocardioides sp. GY 10113]
MRRLLGPILLTVALATTATLTGCTATGGETGAITTAASTARDIDLARFDTADEWRTGRAAGATVVDDRLRFDSPVGTRRYNGHRYEVARWDSPWIAPGFSFTELIASWSAATPGASWIEVRVRGRSAGTGGSRTSWDVLGRWARGDKRIQRSSVSGQTDDGTSVAVDTWRTTGLASYQLRVVLLRGAGGGARPSLDLTTAMASALPSTAGATSTPGPGRGIVLPVPRYSQMVHTGHYPEWGGGGEAWCSPTSTSMVLGYYDALPRPRTYRWVAGEHTDPWVDHAARMTYDHTYDGTGNWPFTTAYAAPLAGKAFVTRLRSLREAERFIAAGIPLVVSVAFGRGELDGTPISASNGHLLVISGFRQNGDVVVNDPASSTRAGVRRTYGRDQFEKVWLEASGGLAYVIHDQAHPLPSSPGNW